MRFQNAARDFVAALLTFFADRLREATEKRQGDGAIGQVANGGFFPLSPGVSWHLAQVTDTCSPRSG